MLVINYKENKPISDYFKYSVNGNNQADIVRFVLLKEQEGIDLSDENFLVYAKCTDGYDFTDKVLISREDIEITDSEIIVDWHLLRKHTANESLKVSVSFESEEIVWQTQTFTLKINNGILGDDEIENKYPTILQELQAEIDELKQHQGGGASEVLIEKVWLTYDDKMSIRSDYLGRTYDDGDEERNFVNDSTRIWVNFKTTPINSKMEEEIKNGRFVIRLDYPIQTKSNHTGNVGSAGRVEVHQPQGDYGFRYKGYTHSYKHLLGNVLEDKKRDILLNSLIFVNESDIKVNDYGEKYIHKKVSFFDYVNNICKFDASGDIPLQPLTNYEVNNDLIDCFNEYINGSFLCGIPHLLTNGAEGGFGSFAKMKLYKSQAFGVNAESCNSKKLNPAFSCYSPLKFPDNYSVVSQLQLLSPYIVNGSRDNATYKNISGKSFIMINKADSYNDNQNNNKRKYLSAKPRCCILNDNYETADVAFIKKYPQAEQNIRLYCKNILDIQDYGVSYVPIFRMLITQK